MNTERLEPMTIGKAKELFTKYKTSLLPDYDNLVRLFRRNNIEHPISNSCHLHALLWMEVMFRNTFSSFQMVTGEDGLPDCLLDAFSEMLRRVQRSGGKARVIVIGDDSSSWDLLESDFDVLEVLRGVPVSPHTIPHFMVCDGMVRSEESTSSDNGSVVADVYLCNDVKAKVFGEKFDAFWGKLTKKVFVHLN